MYIVNGLFTFTLAVFAGATDLDKMLPMFPNCFEEGIGYPAGASAIINVLKQIRTPEVCMVFCLANPKCQVFTHNSDGKCYLKTLDVKAAEKQPGKVSGKRANCEEAEVLAKEFPKCFEEGIGYPAEASAIVNMINGIKNPEECLNLCLWNPECQVFTLTGKEKCYLKTSDVRAAEKRTGGVSGKRAICEETKELAKKFPSCFEEGIGYPAEASAIVNKVKEVKTSVECLNLCLGDPKCQVFTLTGKEVCYLKTADVRAAEKRTRGASGKRANCE